MFFRSLRFRLTLWYVVTLAVVLAASGFFWYWYLSREIRRHVDQRLAIVAVDVAAFHLDTHAQEPLVRQPDEEHCQGLEDFVRSHNWGEYVQLLSERGVIACSSRNLGGSRLPLSKEALQRAAQGIPHFETIRALDHHEIRLLTYPVRKGTRIAELVQVGADLSQTYETLEHLRLLLLIFSPLALAVISVGGWFLAGRALLPMVRLTEAARRINAENLSQRLPQTSTGDEIARLAETFNDVLARLDQSFTKVRQFTADASHELRTPLAILKGETEVALRWGRSAEELMRTLESNLEEIDRMGRILEDLLTLAKSEAGELHLSLAELSLSDLLQALYLQGKALGEAKGVEVTLHLQVAGEVRLRGDELQLHRAFLNLLANAVKYTPAGGKVELTLALQAREAVVAVADTGIGIAPQHLPHIFDRFYRVDEARNRAVGGTGLGLAIVRSIVEAHGGRIEVASTPEQGSRFTVHLPVAGPSPREMKEQA